MFLPRSLRCDAQEELRAAIATMPLGTLITMDDSHQPVLDHLPFVVEAPHKDAPFGSLLTHAARANPHWHRAHQERATVSFHSPGAYVSPTYYDTYQSHTQHVPTYYYVAVHARGTLHTTLQSDALRRTLAIQTAHLEALHKAQDLWTLQLADPDYLDRLLSAIVGIRITCTEPMVGKFKLGQDKSQLDRQSVQAHLAQHDYFAQHIASLMLTDDEHVS